MSLKSWSRDQLASAIRRLLEERGEMRASEILEAVRAEIDTEAQKPDIESVLSTELRSECRRDARTNRWMHSRRSSLNTGLVGAGISAPASDRKGSVSPPSKEQQRAIEFQPSGHLLVRGEAGSGKTTVLAARALQLRERFGGESFLFLTYNRSLAANVARRLRRAGAEDGIEICTFHEWAMRFVYVHGFEMHGWEFPDSRKARLTTLIAEKGRGTAKAPVLTQSVEWWSEEFSWIYGQALTALEDYVTAVRTGRGGAIQVRREERLLVWAVFQEYESALRAEGLWDVDDPGGLVLRCAGRKGFLMQADVVRDHVFVDEVQDFDKAWLMALLPVARRSLSLAGDLAQRIYRRSFSWKEVGIDVRGSRSKSLKGSFRTTRQIMDVARFLATNPDVTGDPDYVPPTIPTREGPRVVRICRSSRSATLEAALRWIAALTLSNPSASCVVACPFNRSLPEVADSLSALRVEVTVAKREALAEEQKGTVLVTTFHQLKGLEFDNVLLLELQDATMPGWYLKKVAPEDIATVEPYLRRVVYVALTRARHQAAIAGRSPISRFFAEVPGTYFEEA